MDLHLAYIALGANLGARSETIDRALSALRQRTDTRVETVSALIETEPVGGPSGQPKYLNGATAVRTSLTARELLNVLLSIESDLGRDRSSGERNAPRVIDLDLLLYDDLVLNDSGLILPHPRMHERAFVLRPLVEIAPDVIHPVLQRSIRDLCGTIC